MRFIIYIIIFSIFSGAASAARSNDNVPIAVNLSRVGENFDVSIKNVSNDFVKINKMFSIDPLFGTVHFIFIGSKKYHNIVGQINSDPVNEGSYIELHPGNFYGMSFTIKNLELMYGVKDTCYTVSVYYLDGLADKHMAVMDKISSQAIHVCKSKGSKSEVFPRIFSLNQDVVMH